MNRRQFLKASSSMVMTSALFSQKSFGESQGGALKAIDVQNYLRTLCDVVEPSSDRIIIGDPNTEVTKMGTCWMPYWKTLKKAVSEGVNTLIVHEPTFYAHWDLDHKEEDYWLRIEIDLGSMNKKSPEAARAAYIALMEKKKQWIEEHGLVIIRCHDVMDKIAEFGIPYALGQALGFTNNDIIRSRTFYNVYRIDPAPAIDVAKHIATQFNSVGQPGVAFYGDPQYMVKSVGLGTGCICNPIDFMDLNPDLYISIDDTIRTWIQTTYAEDSGQPLVVINHGTSEEFGPRTMNTHLRTIYPDYEIIHFEQGCSYRWVVA